MEEMILAAHTALRGLPRFAIEAIPAGIWGSPRHSRDLDMVVYVAPTRIGALVETLRVAGFVPSPAAGAVLSQGKTAKFKWARKRRLSLDVSLVRLSLDKAALSRRVNVRFLGKIFPIASPEDTILYKLARFWDQDRADIRAILLRQRLDWDYMQRMAAGYFRDTGDPSTGRGLEQISSWERR